MDMSKELEFLLQGVENEWWESVDEKRLEPIPFPVVFNLKTKEIRKHLWNERFKMHLWKTIDTLEEHETLMAHVLAKAGFFVSVGDAKKSGWKKPIEIGRFKFKNRGILEVVED